MHIVISKVALQPVVITPIVTVAAHSVHQSGASTATEKKIKQHNVASEETKEHTITALLVTGKETMNNTVTAPTVTDN
ncbi:hypothetical protein K7432_008539 [Basidiobolus ranarum]|uniref:Secreted protein n=1 Tax=Basidiobolus ranarum TaxID=34480 RepID=A0ABR2VYG6_9FUNG